MRKATPSSGEGAPAECVGGGVLRREEDASGKKAQLDGRWSEQCGEEDAEMDAWWKGWRR